jgi:hypothetical protein
MSIADLSGNAAMPAVVEIDQIASAEFDRQIATAKKYPRSISGFLKSALALATLNEVSAQQCIYCLPARDGKEIEGPSARMAEILAATYGNNRRGARIVGVDAEFITAEGLFHDLENNTALALRVQRRIVNAKGQRYGTDMLQVTGNAACAIALRNATLGGIPRAIWWDIYGSARKTVIGDIATLAKKRATMFEKFAPFGVTPAQIAAALGVEGAADIGPDQLVRCAGFLTAITEEGTDPESIFPSVQKLRGMPAGPAKPPSEPAKEPTPSAPADTAKPEAEQPKQDASAAATPSRADASAAGGDGSTATSPPASGKKKGAAAKEKPAEPAAGEIVETPTEKEVRNELADCKSTADVNIAMSFQSRALERLKESDPASFERCLTMIDETKQQLAEKAA